MEHDNLKKVVKLIQTPIEHSEKFLKGLKPHHTDFFGHMLHTFKKHTPAELKPHVAHVLRSKTPRIAKGRMIKANRETGGGMFDWLKKTGSSVAHMASNLGSQVVQTAHNFYDKAKPLAEKGFQMAKPYIKQYGPDAVGMATGYIPAVGPVLAPIAKKGAQMLFNKFL